MKTNTKTTLLNTISILFGLYVIAHGILNVSVGNDRDFGVGLLLISLLFFPIVTKITKGKTGISVPCWAKIALALIIIWVTLAVGAFAEGYLPEFIQLIKQ